MLGQPLDFDPGMSWAYSNFGYCVLGRIIEKITGRPYEKYVREEVLAPAGITRMRIGASLRAQGSQGEAAYYTRSNSTVRSVFDNAQVPLPYGGFYLEAMDAHGGWLASAVDLARFAVALERGAPSPPGGAATHRTVPMESAPLLKAETLRMMYRRPAPPVALDKQGK